MDSSSEDFEDLNCIEEGDLDTLDDISEDGPKKPHFLDYDAAPPTGEELQFSCYSSLPESSSRQSLGGLANDLDKNNANEKSSGSAITTTNVPSSGGSEVGLPTAVPVTSGNNRVLLTRRQSTTEAPAVSTSSSSSTGTRKKEYLSSTGSNNGYHSLDYESVPINRVDRR